MKSLYAMMLATVGMMGCAATNAETPITSVTISDLQVSRGQKVWLVQRQPNEADKVIFCQANKVPVCVQVWDGYRSTFQENTLPDNPYP